MSKTRAFIKLFRSATFTACRARAVGLRPCVPVLLFKDGTCIKIFGQAEEHKLGQLLHACELGDRKPTGLLAEICKLLGTKELPCSAKKLIYI